MADGLNWYRYANNNPIMYKDPTGERLVLNNESEEDRQTVLNDINQYSLTQYKLDENNELVKDKDATKRVELEESTRKKAGLSSLHSKSYSKQIDMIRKSKNTLYIRIAESDKEMLDMNEVTAISRAGGGYTDVDSATGNVQVAISREGPEGNALSILNKDGSGYLDLDRGQILIHEIMGHAAPFIEYNGNSTKGREINAIEEDNKVRREIGLEERYAEPNHIAYYPHIRRKHSIG
ncbi:hypothetical protein PVA45_05990 [Entomospira entomophila]|nr:hypothetical protein [Entomospira entomophilus]WDI35258.1 hypothetical protein PVA45_05990 [Entomospira entomophilus]